MDGDGAHEFTSEEMRGPSGLHEAVQEVRRKGKTENDMGIGLLDLAGTWREIGCMLRLVDGRIGGRKQMIEISDTTLKLC